jgi:catechol 2,3-dioxygenase-like lactoylglutathione lyase family enzyme
VCMKNSAILRVARPTHDLRRIVDMYARGLGLRVLAAFADHDGFDGIVLGHAGSPYHLEFTAERGDGSSAPDHDQLLVFFVSQAGEWEQACTDMVSAGFRQVRSHNPYWDVRGRTFEDFEGFRVVLQREDWVL